MFLAKSFSFVPDFFLKILENLSKYLYYITYESRKKKNLTSTIILEDHKVKLHLKRNDNQAHDVYRSLNYKNKIYELPLISILLNILKKKQYDNFLDLGSFIGYYPCIVSKYLNDNSVKIYAVESNPDYCKVIEKNLKENKISNVNVFNEILSDKIESLFIHKETVLNEKFDINSIQKNSITLDQFCKNNNILPKIIKIDVHGFEGKILEGFKKIENSVEIILLELHPEKFLKKYSNTSKKSIIEYLLKTNLNCYLIPFENNLKIYDIEKNTKIENYKNSYRQIFHENFHDLFFDKMDTDNLILVTKKNINLKEFNCFKNL